MIFRVSQGLSGSPAGTRVDLSATLRMIVCGSDLHYQQDLHTNMLRLAACSLPARSLLYILVLTRYH
jgi:hypothetical protein